MFETVLRIAFSLLLVLGLMWGMARLVRQPLGRRTGSALSVLARHQLTRNSAVAVVRVADRALILGVTDSQVTMLGETDLAELEKHQPAPAHRGGRAVLTRRAKARTDHDGSGTGWPGLAGDDLADDPRPFLSDERREAVPVRPDDHPGPLDGSLLSPRTWRRTVTFLRDRTSRR